MEKLTTTHQLDFFGISDRGLVRKVNQDVWDCDPHIPLFLLADGMGGHKAGEVAAQETVRFVIDYVKEHHNEEQDLLIFYKRAILQANRWVYEKGRKEKKYDGMGTTLVLLSFHDEQIVIAHVGDSRIYRLRDEKLERLTEDHSLAQELLVLGTTDQEESQLAPFKNVLTRAIGTYPSVEPSLQLLQRREKDLYLLCSDGLTNYVSDETINKILNSHFSLSERGERLVALAKQQGGGDNITLILVQSKEDDLPRQ